MHGTAENDYFTCLAVPARGRIGNGNDYAAFLLAPCQFWQLVRFGPAGCHIIGMKDKYTRIEIAQTQLFLNAHYHPRLAITAHPRNRNHS